VRVTRLLQTLIALATALAPHAAHAARPLEPQDWYRFAAVSDLVIAPDGRAVAYLVTSYDKDSDESRGAVWTADWDGRQSMQLTHADSASAPRFTPDGRSVSFLSAHGTDERAQLWVLDRRGGEPRQLTHVSDEITDYAWSGDGRRVALVMRAAERDKRPRPQVIDAYHFKQDQEGYLTAESRTHLYLLDVASGACGALAADPERADSHPVFSPDSRQIAFIGNGAAREHAGRDDIYVLAAQPGAQPRLVLSTWSPNNQWLAWSPEGAALGFLQGDELKYNAYIDDKLALVEVKSGRIRSLSARLDRGVYSPRFSDGGRAILFAVEDDDRQYLARVSLASGEIAPVATGNTVVHQIAAAAGRTALLASSANSPKEVYALEHGQLRPLSAHNQALFTELATGRVEDIAFRSSDGTEIHGQIVKPPGYDSGRRYPTLVWIHGGPQGQDDHSLELEGYGPPLERQLFASHGYVVLAINYRGSTGRGAQFARAIVADWGHKEVEDLLAGVDWAVSAGIADPARLGIGGWSYGGLLTNYVTASDGRFKAAIAGAGSGDHVGLYGSDEYIVEDDYEIGPPWRSTELWLKLSYPFYHADRIHTPTLYMGGDKDFDVPIAGGEQMYQALRSLGVPTQLIVYPGEYHTFTRPSFLVDRWTRYLAWMAQYLK
jgi:dipeptidyl aminopeptidase/acylaminoacyl peptidase